MTTKAKKQEPKKKEEEAVDFLKPFEDRKKELEASGKHKDVIILAVPIDNSYKKWTACYIKKPSRDTISNVLGLINRGQVLEASELLIQKEWIEGDKRILDDDELFYSAHMTVQDIVTFRTGLLKKS